MGKLEDYVAERYAEDLRNLSALGQHSQNHAEAIYDSLAVMEFYNKMALHLRGAQRLAPQTNPARSQS